MKTALSIVQSVRKRLNLPNITALAGATDPDELQMIELLYAVCEELRQARCWTQLKRKHSFTTSAGRTQYPLPADFYSPLAKTHWNTSEDLRLIGPESDSDFGEILYGASPSSLNFTYRVFGGDENTATAGGQIEISPTPSPLLWVAGTSYSVGDQVTGSGGHIYICTDAITTSATEPSGVGAGTEVDDDGVWTWVSAWTGTVCSFEYLTRSFLIPKYWTLNMAAALNSYCYVDGNIYKCTDAITATDTKPTGQATTEVVDDDGKWLYQGGAYETVVADTDLVVFDDDLVKLGLRAKWLEESDGDYSEAKAEFEMKISKAVSRYRGPHVGSFCGSKQGPRYRVTPNRGWVFP